MIKYFCDRCGKELNPYTALKLSYKSIYIEREAVGPVTHEYMLCDACTEEFRTWVAPEKKETKT